MHAISGSCALMACSYALVSRWRRCGTALNTVEQRHSPRHGFVRWQVLADVFTVAVAVTPFDVGSMRRQAPSKRYLDLLNRMPANLLLKAMREASCRAASLSISWHRRAVCGMSSNKSYFLGQRVAAPAAPAALIREAPANQIVDDVAYHLDRGMWRAEDARSWPSAIRPSPSSRMLEEARRGRVGGARLAEGAITRQIVRN